MGFGFFSFYVFLPHIFGAQSCLFLGGHFPQTGLPVGFYLRKKETGHAGGRAVLCWARIWPCWARGADLDLAVLGALGWVGRAGGRGGLGRAGLGWVGFGSGGRAGLGWVRIWLSVYGLHCTCHFHVFMMSLCLSSCVSQLVSWGLSKTKHGIRK